MALTPELNDLVCRHGQCAEEARSEVMRDLLRNLCGCDYASTGNTTRAEAEQVAALLALRPGQRLLDVGAGSGWPGLYLAQISGCDLVMADLPLAALRNARERAVLDGVDDRCVAVVADGAALPFRDASFDALNHSDLLCCTPDKLGVLQECRRVAREGARMTFTVISLANSLDGADRRFTIDAAPKFVESDEGYAALVGRSHWHVQEHIDLTPEFLQFARGEGDGMEAREDALSQMYGAAEFAGRVKRLDACVAAIEAGWLRREMFVAVAG
jgi:ubiquinone/menaquinone biosynthesis C-methylase UbiE